MTWNIEFTKEKGIDRNSYLDTFLQQAPDKIYGLELTQQSVESFANQHSPPWVRYNTWYTTPGKFASRGAYMDIDFLCDIHDTSGHTMNGASQHTVDLVYDMFASSESIEEDIPLTPFVLLPSSYKYVSEDEEVVCKYELEKEGRSRLAGVRKARDDGHFSGKIPVLFAVRQARK